MNVSDPSDWYACQRAAAQARELPPWQCRSQASESEAPAVFLPSPFVWREPATISPRPWLYGQHLLRRQVSGTVGAPGLAKSSHGIVDALAMTSGRALLGDRPVSKLRVWIFNLEDPLEELDRRITAAMLHHRVTPQEIEGWLFRDSGREHPLCTAIQTRAGTQSFGQPWIVSRRRSAPGRSTSCSWTPSSPRIR